MDRTSLSVDIGNYKCPLSKDKRAGTFFYNPLKFNSYETFSYVVIVRNRVRTVCLVGGLFQRYGGG